MPNYAPLTRNAARMSIFFFEAKKARGERSLGHWEFAEERQKINETREFAFALFPRFSSRCKLNFLWDQLSESHPYPIP